MNEPHTTTLGRQVARYRREAKLSAEQLAERAGLGLTRSIIANLENGRKQDVTVRQLMALALVLGVSPADLQFDIRRHPYAPVEIGEHPGRSASIGVRGIDAPQYLARGWFGGARSAEELSGAVVEPRDPDAIESLPFAPSSPDAFALSEIQRLLDQRSDAAYALLVHERQQINVENSTPSAQGTIDRHLPSDPDVLRTRIRDFRAELHEIDRKLRAYDVDLEEPIIYPGPPF